MRQTLFWLAFLAAPAAFADPVTIPLYRRTNDGIVRTGAEQLDNGVLGGKVLIGSPPQEFTMAFDTSSGYSWVRGSRCKTENCLGRCTFYSTRSKTAESTGQKFKVKYDNACVETTIYLDDVEFGGQKVKMPFGGAYRMTGFDHGFDGYFGLGRDVDFNHTTFYTNPTKNLIRRDVFGASSFVTNAYQQAIGLESAQFGMYTTSSSDNGFGQSGLLASSSATSSTPSSSSSTIESATNSSAPSVSTPMPVTSSSTIAAATTTAMATAITVATTTDTTITSGGIGITSDGFGFVKRHNTDAPAGYLVLGGIDKNAIKGDIQYIDLAENSGGRWDIPITLVRFGMDLMIQQKSNAVASISTSQQYITMPADQADIFHEVYGGKLQDDTQTYKVKCSKISTLPNLELYLGNYLVEIPPQYWTRVIDRRRDCCATRIARGSNSVRDWVLGTAFTNLFYISFDPTENRIGLAFKKDQNQDGLNLVKKF
ncbi:aspartic peptidase domain-containing protein [Dichotomocladium elegans]|nr:aspartic peptidase domain-containing protein [Dichotomocladium elegans]